jgi:FlaA1/EpsC-like NDP-sugar epimerase
MQRTGQNEGRQPAPRRPAGGFSETAWGGDGASRPDASGRGVRHAMSQRARHFLKPQVWLVAAVHLAVFIALYRLAFLIRFEWWSLPPQWDQLFWATLPWAMGIKFTVFLLFGQYEGWWAYVTFADLIALVRASVLASLAIVAVEYFLGSAYYTPRYILIMDCMGGIAILGALRGSWRIYREQFWPIFHAGDQRWALLVGTDHSTGMLAHQIQSHGELPYRIRGLVAVEDTLVESRLGQIPILGKLEDICDIAEGCQATDVLITAGTLPGSRLRHLMNACQEAGLELKIIRRLEDRLGGDDQIPIRDIEISDLLRRAPVELDMKVIGQLVQQRVVMVTGAGGSIGGEICRQLLRFNPRQLLLVGRGENRIFKVERELRALQTMTSLCPAIADVTDQARMRQLFDLFRPEVVFHAAAHKHVPLMELNVGEAIKNNVLGTECVANLAHEFGVRNFVFISTDKAVHPTSIMGVSKHLAERYVHAMSRNSATKFTVVRFGNVLGSDGSVVPVFQEQIRHGGPITVTDPRMTRFFMTIPEASQLVLQAAAMGSGGEIFVLEMGEPVKIVDLARDLIRLSGLPEDAIEISFIGIRPGEKLYEELYFDYEETLPTKHAKLRAACHRQYNMAQVHEALDALRELIHAPETVLRGKLHELVPEYVEGAENGKGGNSGGYAGPAPAPQSVESPGGKLA